MGPRRRYRLRILSTSVLRRCTWPRRSRSRKLGYSTASGRGRARNSGKVRTPWMPYMRVWGCQSEFCLSCNVAPTVRCRSPTNRSERELRRHPVVLKLRQQSNGPSPSLCRTKSELMPTCRRQDSRALTDQQAHLDTLQLEHFVLIFSGR